MIYLNCPSTENVIEWDGKAFKKMTNLKTLIIENGHFSKGPEYLPSSLTFLKWKGCPSKSLSFFLNKASEVISFYICVYFYKFTMSILSKFYLFVCFFFFVYAEV
jgi:hypothetical protein